MLLESEMTLEMVVCTVLWYVVMLGDFPPLPSTSHLGLSMVRSQRFLESS